VGQAEQREVARGLAEHARVLRELQQADAREQPKAGVACLLVPAPLRPAVPPGAPRRRGRAEVGPGEYRDDNCGAAHPALYEVLDRRAGRQVPRRTSVQNPATSNCYAIHAAQRPSAGQ
jgi:hypothetical protein